MQKSEEGLVEVFEMEIVGWMNICLEKYFYILECFVDIRGLWEIMGSSCEGSLRSASLNFGENMSF